MVNTICKAMREGLGGKDRAAERKLQRISDVAGFLSLPRVPPAH